MKPPAPALAYARGARHARAAGSMLLCALLLSGTALRAAAQAAPEPPALDADLLQRLQALGEQLRHTAVGRECKHLVTLRVALHDIEGVHADRAGRTEDAHTLRGHGGVPGQGG